MAIQSVRALSLAGAPETPSDRDRVDRASIWRRDRMLEKMLYSGSTATPQFMQDQGHRAMYFVWSRDRML